MPDLDPRQYLPDELLLYIFQLLPFACLVQVRCVSGRWRRVLDAEIIWKRLCLAGRVLQCMHRAQVSKVSPFWKPLFVQYRIATNSWKYGTVTECKKILYHSPNPIWRLSAFTDSYIVEAIENEVIDHRLKLLSFVDDTTVSIHKSHRQYVYAIQMSHDGKHVLLEYTRSISVHCASTGQLVFSVVHDCDIYALHLHKLAVLQSAKTEVIVYDIRSGNEINRVQHCPFTAHSTILHFVMNADFLVTFGRLSWSVWGVKSYLNVPWGPNESPEDADSLIVKMGCDNDPVAWAVVGTSMITVAKWGKCGLHEITTVPLTTTIAVSQPFAFEILEISGNVLLYQDNSPDDETATTVKVINLRERRVTRLLLDPGQGANGAVSKAIAATIVSDKLALISFSQVVDGTEIGRSLVLFDVEMVGMSRVLLRTDASVNTCVISASLTDGIRCISYNENSSTDVVLTQYTASM